MKKDQSTEDTLRGAFKSADLGDKAWLFFSQHGRPFKLLAIAIVLALGVGICATVSRTLAQRSMKAAYLDVLAGGDGEKFAKKYATSQLGGTVFLELGDGAYEKKEYNRAKDYYHRALEGLGRSIFAGRAALGESVALIKSGMVSEGEKLLAKIGEERSYPLSIRGNATYLLALSIYGRGNIDSAKNISNGLVNGNFPAHWKEKAEELLREIGMGR
jgi:TolA-binding protein